MRTGVAETVDDHDAPSGKWSRNSVQPWNGGVAIFSSDVTGEHLERVRVSQELEVLQQVVDHVDAMVLLMDLQGHYLLVNRALADFLGRRPADMLGLRAGDGLPADLAEAAEAAEAAVLADGRARHGEVVLELVPGRPRTLSTVRFPAYDAAGRLSGVGTVYTDITPRREAEAQLAEALRESAGTVALVETLQRSSPVGFAVMDRDFRFVRVNDAMAALNGLPAREHGRHVS